MRSEAKQSWHPTRPCSWTREPTGNRSRQTVTMAPDIPPLVPQIYTTMRLPQRALALMALCASRRGSVAPLHPRILFMFFRVRMQLLRSQLAYMVKEQQDSRIPVVSRRAAMRLRPPSHRQAPSPPPTSFSAPNAFHYRGQPRNRGRHGGIRVGRVASGIERLGRHSVL